MHSLFMLATWIWIVLTQQVNRFQREQAAIDELTRLGVCVYTASNGPERLPEIVEEQFVWMVNPRDWREASGVGRVRFLGWGRVDPTIPMSKLDVFLGIEAPMSGAGDGYPSDASRVADATLAHVAEFKSCNFVNLERAGISDEGLVQLQSLQYLRYLNLRETDVTDAGLAHLEPLKRLQWLKVQKTRVTKEGIEALRKAIPQLEIASDFEIRDSRLDDEILGILEAHATDESVDVQRLLGPQDRTGQSTDRLACRTQIADSTVVTRPASNRRSRFGHRLSTRGRSCRRR